MFELIGCIVFDFILIYLLEKLAVTEIVGFESFKNYAKDRGMQEDMLRSIFYREKTIHQLKLTILTAICVYLLVNYFWVESVSIIVNSLVFGVFLMLRLQKAEEISAVSFVADFGSLMVFIVAAMYPLAACILSTIVVLILIVFKNFIEFKGVV